MIHSISIQKLVGIGLMLGSFLFTSIQSSIANQCEISFSSFSLPEGHEVSDARVDQLHTLVNQPKIHSKKLIAQLSEDFLLDGLFRSKITDEGQTLRRHTQIVLHRLEKQRKWYPVASLEDTSSLALFRMMLALHDIGKPVALELGNSKLQFKFTLPIVERVLTDYGFRENDIDFAKKIIGNDHIGDGVQGILTLEQTRSNLRDTWTSLKTRISWEEYFKLQFLYYLCDSGAYRFVHEINYEQLPNGKTSIKHPFIRALLKAEAPEYL